MSEASATTSTDRWAPEELIRAFAAGDIAPGAFHHREHVHLTWALLREMPLDAAIDWLRRHLIRFATAAGKPEKYHETITVFFAKRIHDRMSQHPQETWEAFADRNRDLVGSSRDFLLRYYREATLQSDPARRAYVPPDIAQSQ